VIDFVRSHGRLPRDRWDNTLGPDDLLVWFGLERLGLSAEERRVVKGELRALAEAEMLMDLL
jgi:hypothetical protein